MRSPRGCSLFCLLSRLGSQGLPLGGVLGAGTFSYLMSRVAAEEAELKLEVVVPLLRSQLVVFSEFVSVRVLRFGRRRRLRLGQGLQRERHGTGTVAIGGGLLQFVGMGRSSVRRGTLVTADFGLTFPVSLVEDLHLVLEGNQCFGFPNPGELVLETIREPLIELPVEGLVVPTGVRRVLIEVEGVFHSLVRVLVSKVLDANSGFVDGVVRAEEATEFVDEHRCHT